MNVQTPQGDSGALRGAESRSKIGRHGFGVFDKAVASKFEILSEEHGLTEDGKTGPPFLCVPFYRRLTNPGTCWFR